MIAPSFTTFYYFDEIVHEKKLPALGVQRADGVIAPRTRVFAPGEPEFMAYLAQGSHKRREAWKIVFDRSLSSRNKFTRFSAKAALYRHLIRFTIGFIAIAVLVAGSVWVRALNEPAAPSRYRPELKHELTQQERWKLNFDLANEVFMKENSSRRPEAPAHSKTGAMVCSDCAVVSNCGLDSADD